MYTPADTSAATTAPTSAPSSICFRPPPLRSRAPPGPGETGGAPQAPGGGGGAPQPAPVALAAAPAAAQPDASPAGGSPAEPDAAAAQGDSGAPGGAATGISEVSEGGVSLAAPGVMGATGSVGFAPGSDAQVDGVSAAAGSSGSGVDGACGSSRRHGSEASPWPTSSCSLTGTSVSSRQAPSPPHVKIGRAHV